jgi:hypothetical protein
VNQAAKECFQMMNKGEPRTAKCLLSFLSALCASGGLDVCDEDKGFGPTMLQPILDRVSNGQSQFEQDQHAALFVSIMPVCANALSSGSWDVQAAMEVVGHHMSNRLGLYSSPASVCSLKSKPRGEEEEEESLKVQDSLEAMWEEVLEMSKTKFSDVPSCRSFVWTELKDELCDAIATQIDLSVDAEATALTLSWQPIQQSLIFPVVNVFSSNCGEFGRALSSLPRLSSVLLKDLCVDVLYAFEPIVLWNGLVQGTLETAAQQLLSLAHVVEGIRADFLVVETILSLAVVPSSYLNEVSTGRGVDLLAGGRSSYFGLMLLELCKIDVKSCEPIAIAFDVLWQSLDQLDDTCALRAAELLAHHLNNTKFRWPFWQRWSDSLDFDDDLSVEIRFLRHVFGVAVNLNHSTSRLTLFLSEVGAELPSELMNLLPPTSSPSLNEEGSDEDEKYGQMKATIRDSLFAQVDLAERRRLLGAEGLIGQASDSTHQLAQYITSIKVDIFAV